MPARIARHLYAALAALTALATPALPCARPEPFAVSDIALGPVVVAATVADYRLEDGDGILTLNITDVWKGQAPAHLTARWETRLAEPPPESWDRPAAVIAALAPSDTGFDVVVEMCGSAWLVQDTPDNRAAVRAALTP